MTQHGQSISDNGSKNMNTHTHTHTQEYYSVIEKEWNNAICSNTDGPRDYHAKWSKSEKDKYHISLTCGI